MLILDHDTVVETTLENLLKGGVLLEQEKDKYRKALEAMSHTDLLLTLLESHGLRETVEAIKIKMN